MSIQIRLTFDFLIIPLLYLEAIKSTFVPIYLSKLLGWIHHRYNKILSFIIKKT